MQPPDSPRTPLAQVLAQWFQCVMARGHDWESDARDARCRRCPARRTGPSLFDLMVEKKGTKKEEASVGDYGSFVHRGDPEGGGFPDRIYLGFWHGTYQPTLPDPLDFVDESWSLVERRAVADYIDRGQVTASYKGMSACRICGIENGSEDKSDGVYVWPSGFSHYVRDHAVKPPPAFIDCALGR